MADFVELRRVQDLALSQFADQDINRSDLHDANRLPREGADIVGDAGSTGGRSGGPVGRGRVSRQMTGVPGNQSAAQPSACNQISDCNGKSHAKIVTDLAS
jgi:hypothetical protein